MKNLILVIVALLVGGCASTPDKPVKELTLREKVVGTYEVKRLSYTFRHVFLDNGTVEFYTNGRKDGEGLKWSLVENEIHIKFSNYVSVYRINPDNSITKIVYIDKDGKRTDYEFQLTYKKIK